MGNFIICLALNILIFFYQHDTFCICNYDRSAFFSHSLLKFALHYVGYLLGRRKWICICSIYFHSILDLTRFGYKTQLTGYGITGPQCVAHLDAENKLLVFLIKFPAYSHSNNQIKCISL